MMSACVNRSSCQRHDVCWFSIGDQQSLFSARLWKWEVREKVVMCSSAGSVPGTTEDRNPHRQNLKHPLLITPPSFYQTEALGEMYHSNLSIMVPTFSLPQHMLAFINLRHFEMYHFKRTTGQLAYSQEGVILFFFQSTSIRWQPLVQENILAVTINLHNILVMSFSPTCTHSLNYAYSDYPLNFISMN